MENKSIVIVEPHKVIIKDSPMPVPGKDEALLELLYGGICGSDLGTYRGTFSYAVYPCIPGHEFAARILEIPENDKGLKPGMIVTGNPYFNCGSCYSCRRGYLNCCTDNKTMGCSSREGAFSNYIAFPIDRIYDGKGLDPERLALVEPFCISYHAVQRAQIKPGDRVMIMGAGTIGVNAMLAAKTKGATVYMADVAEKKLEYAKKLGADGIILNDSPEHFIEQVKEATNGDFFDVTMEAVGLPQTFQACIDAVCFAGHVCLIGIGNRNMDFQFTLIQKKELNIHGSRNALKQDFLDIIDLFASGKIDPMNIVSAEYAFDNAPQLFADFEAHAGELLKVVLKF